MKEPLFLDPEEEKRALEEAELMAMIAASPIVDKDAASVANRPSRQKVEKRERKRGTKENSTPFFAAIDSEIDLHGYTVAEAEAELIHEVAIARKQGWKRLRVVHGGAVGQYGPVAKRVEKLLRTTLSKQVTNWKTEGHNSGATIVELAPCGEQTPEPKLKDFL